MKIDFTVLQVLNVTFVLNRNDANPDSNLWVGLALVISFFLVISVLAFPNGTGLSYLHFSIYRILSIFINLIIFAFFILLLN